MKKSTLSLIRRGACMFAATLALGMSLAPATASADGRHDRGHHRGWDKHHGRGHYRTPPRRWDGTRWSISYVNYSPSYYRPRPVYVTQPVVVQQPVYVAAPAVQNVSYAGNSGYCREYNTTSRIGGRIQTTYGTACMQPDGSWQRVN